MSTLCSRDKIPWFHCKNQLAWLRGCGRFRLSVIKQVVLNKQARSCYFDMQLQKRAGSPMSIKWNVKEFGDMSLSKKSHQQLTAWENIRFTFSLPNSKRYWQVKYFLCSVLRENFKKDKWYLLYGCFLRDSNIGQSSEKKLQRWCVRRLCPFTETHPIWEWLWGWEKKTNVYFSGPNIKFEPC